MKIGFIGDMGETENSSSTLDNMILQNPGGC